MSRHDRYNHSEKGRARYERYRQSEKGRAVARAKQARYRATLKGVQTNARAEFKVILTRANDRKEG